MPGDAISTNVCGGDHTSAALVQTLMASDVVAITGLIYKYARPGDPFSNSGADLLHVCGAVTHGSWRRPTFSAATQLQALLL